MVEIIAHRGFWHKSSKKNKPESFYNAFENNFGVETDIRDYSGELVISHDIPNSDSLLLDDLLDKYNVFFGQSTNSPTLALNIKSDGLYEKLKDVIDKKNIINYFVFDMSIPDTFSYLNGKTNAFLRISEYETISQNFLNINGIWLDQFNSNWYNQNFLKELLIKWQNVCVVSPELHGRRDYLECWRIIKNLELSEKFNIMICTDFPDKAREYFEQN